MNQWIDSHAHIYLKEFDNDREEMLTRSSQQGVEKIYMPNIDSSSIDAMMEVEHAHPAQCYAMMGLHPCSVKNKFEQALYQVETWLSKRKFVALGEIGIDLHWDTTYREHQQEAFTIQLAWAKKYDLPIVVHSRNSMDEIITLLASHSDSKLKGVIHCFTGTVEQAERLIDMGFYIGVGGIVTFPKAGVDKVLAQLKTDTMLLETDSPYLAPVPYRGTRNEPAYLCFIAKKIALLIGCSEEELSNTTCANVNQLFGQ